MDEADGSSVDGASAPVGSAARVTAEPAMRRELRIAPIVCGGTSLAVWIGGVTAELYRVVNCRDDLRDADRLYRALLDLTGTDAMIDVVTGTSAGGLNGVLVSTAWANQVPTAEVVGLRDLWLELGSILSLLRSPNEPDPPSLLRGDSYFWPQLTDVLSRLEHAGLVAREQRPPRAVDLQVTVTTLSGERTRRTDDIGQELQETRQDHTLRFQTSRTGTEVGTGDFGAATDWARRLALASRTSASIPGVFEASYLPVGDEVDGRPGFRAVTQSSFSVGRWAVDGGVLVNQPIAAARDRIIDQSVGREMRRVALFVNPTPTPVPPNVADDPKAVPKLARVAASAYTAPRNIGVRHDIDDLHEHNRRVRRAVDVRRVIAQIVGTTSAAPGVDPLVDFAGSVYDRFRHERATLSVTSMLDRVLPGLDVANLPPRIEIENALVHAVRSGEQWLPSRFEGQVGPEWLWGIAPLEYAAGTLLEIVRRLFALPLECLTTEMRARLGEIRAQVHEATDRVREVRTDDTGFWEDALGRLDPAEIHRWASRCYEVWPDASLLDAVAPPAQSPATAGTWEMLWSIAQELAVASAQLAELHRGVTPPATIPIEVRDDWTATQELVSLIDAGAIDDSEATVRRLVALHIIAVSLGDSSRRQAPIEFIEVSWLAPNELDNRRPEDKLAGIEFQRLGAFVKRSWRANDWMWGRMDGAAQLVRLLLDPRRLRQLGVAPQRVLDLLDHLDADGLVAPVDRDRIIAELSFLEPEAFQRPLPASLRATTAAFTKLLQLDIAREELPEVYFAVLRTRAEGGGVGDGGEFGDLYAGITARARLSDAPSDDVVRLLQRCKIGSETAASEVGKDLLTNTTGRTVIVAANAFTGAQSGLSLPSRVTRPLRQVAMLGYVLTQSVVAGSRTGIAIASTLSAVAGAILALYLLRGSTEMGVNSGLVLLAVLILGVGLFLAILRSGVLAAMPGFLALLVVALALLGPDVEQVITGSAERDGAETWRHVVFLGRWPLVTLVLIVASIGWIVSAVGRAATARRVLKADRAMADHRDEPRPSIPWQPVVELLAVVVVVPSVLVLHQPFFTWFLVGEATGWRAWVIDAASWLHARGLVVVVAGLAFFGVFFGLAWDRTVKRLLGVLRRALRRLVGAVGS
jgi:patatin-related protein